MRKEAQRPVLAMEEAFQMNNLGTEMEITEQDEKTKGGP
jgi:hypothetical protein